jgi:hypothetical protein
MDAKLESGVACRVRRIIGGGGRGQGEGATSPIAASG